MSIIHKDEIQMIKILNAEGQLLAEVEGDSLRGAMLANKYLKGAQLAGQDLTGANLDDADLSQANLAGAVLQGASLENTKLVEADLSKAILDGAQLRGPDFTKANMEQASAVGASFVDSNLSHAWARESDFTNAKLEANQHPHFQMNNADFSGAKFDGAQVLGADVSFTCFFGTNFAKSESLGLHCRSHKYESYPKGYPMGFGFSESKYNPFFDNETKWSERMKFPEAGIPWLLIGKHASIAYFWFIWPLCIIGYFLSSWIQEHILNSTFLVVAALLCVAGSYAWFWKRSQEINNEIERDPSLHFGRYVSVRNEYRLGAPMTDGERAECLKFR